MYIIFSSIWLLQFLFCIQNHLCMHVYVHAGVLEGELGSAVTSAFEYTLL